MDFRRAFQVIARCYGGAILCFFAFVPGWILFHAIADAFANPKDFLDLTWLGAVVVCSALMYFLLLLAYRAFTGRGRKQDSGLLPPWTMQVFAIVFALCGAGVSAWGIKRQASATVIAGLIEFLIGVAVFRIAGARRRRASRPSPD
jgi:Na+-driven multidrug efflux pump